MSKAMRSLMNVKYILLAAALVIGLIILSNMKSRDGFQTQTISTAPPTTVQPMPGNPMPPSNPLPPPGLIPPPASSATAAMSTTPSTALSVPSRAPNQNLKASVISISTRLAAIKSELDLLDV